MIYEEIIKVLNKYNITTIDDLEYHLSVIYTNDECQDDPVIDEKNCMNAKCYEEYFVPDCRKIFEVYEKYFQKDIKTKKLFIEYLEKSTSKKKSSLENYLSCKSCNQQIKKGIQNSLKISDSEFKKDFCRNLTIKLNYSSLFESEYTSIKQFLSKDHQVSSDNFTPIYNGEDTMTKEEEKRLFDIVHTSRDEIKVNLSKKENLIGSDKYIFNLAHYAFERNLLGECNLLLEQLEVNSSKYLSKKRFMQLKAKLYSSLQKDREAIEILNKLIEQQKPQLDVESYSLLAASIKRKAFSDYDLYGDEIDFINKLTEAKNIYYSIYQLNQDYYPALNFIYISFMLAYLNNEKQNFFKDLKHQAEEIWIETSHKVTDWWSFISNIEFLILTSNYDEAQQQLEVHFDELDKEDISEFNISSTLRQLNLYKNFCNDEELKKIIEYISNINK